MAVVNKLSDLSPAAQMELIQFLQPWFANVKPKGIATSGGEGLQYPSGSYGPVNKGDSLDIEADGQIPAPLTNFQPGVVYRVVNGFILQQIGGFSHLAELGLFAGDWIGYLDGGDETIYTQGGQVLRYSGGGTIIFYTTDASLPNSGNFEIHTEGTSDDSAVFALGDVVVNTHNVAASDTDGNILLTGGGISGIANQDLPSDDASVHLESAGTVGDFDVVAKGNLLLQSTGGGAQLEADAGNAVIVASGDVNVTPTGDMQVFLKTGQTLTVLDNSNNPIFRVDEDGDLHGLTGKALTFDL